MKRGPRVHFSFRSPFSWMAIHRLRRRLPDAHQRLDFIPYWDPDERTSADLAAAGAEFHYTPMSKAKHLYILHDTRRQAAKLGLRMVWPVDVDPWWELPHLGYLLARRLGRGEQFYDAVTAARWERGENVCEPPVLRAAAERAGLDGDRIVAAAESAEIRAAGVDCLVTAYHDDIFGIPYFRVGPHRFWGLDRLDDFLTELLGPATVPVPTGAPERVLVDTDTAGGCG
ncbi:2-hydroxychromene-2-carboxylate isomerase [Micromonospora echinaurantiaca]|uniref:2-hydroxychromene-2-carboxylate isomerase n=1 Tax=Micromonospora echinaurantiaca TaxID=47857 RepID=A0A1C5HLJ0_9ACTN|nr:DsbA family protein [Micromonospora echinaurantiaca]SCG46773.1 2-hydroxychromene-2-carboxylate isomerase [Micromonospora echinaurantiaca]